ncbi:hypothetical protein NUU61_004120 [Penicillium alfredii]|uniref:Uncharacterized protein n=1 Tax=Penicillium alfredii TaxID=1506179 RepID=A0A9W9FKP0_9EURO|nr:uncharacterized protein NUU61_004120 [Penicillium alfredii]KAJ5101898.1 hypothetical protein NUU61_004120 [Penicillium alfredii]
MPSSKTDTAVRYPESDDQKRRLRNVTQDQKAVSQMQAEAGSGKQKADNSTSWAPGQLLGTHMDDAGNPVPDPASFGDGAKAKKNKEDQDADLYEAMTADFD